MYSLFVCLKMLTVSVVIIVCLITKELFHMTLTKSGGGKTREWLSWMLCNQATGRGGIIEHCILVFFIYLFYLNFTVCIVGRRYTLAQ